MSNPPYDFAQYGFTLVEMIMVIVITGVIAGTVAVFIQKPLVGYFDASRRAALVDVADLALRRISRELRTALPNSVRIAGGGSVIEFLPTLAAARYAESSAEACFANAGCTGVTMLGSLGAAGNAYVGNSLVIFNYYSNSAGDCAPASLPSAYCGHNLALITVSSTSAGQDLFNFAATRFYPVSGSPGRRFQLVGDPVSFACSGGALSRYSGYARQAVQPTAFVGATSALLASGVTTCGFSYQVGARQRMGLVAVRLGLSSGGETVNLYQDIHVDNAP